MFTMKSRKDMKARRAKRTAERGLPAAQGGTLSFRGKGAPKCNLGARIKAQGGWISAGNFGTLSH